MNAIYTFKKLKHPHYKPIDDNFYTIAKLSVELAKKYYKTVFYGDTFSHNMFKSKGIVFDKSIILDSIDTYDGDITSYSKIMAITEQTEPYICLDFDTLLFEKITTTSTITFGYPEVNNVKVSNILKNDDSKSYIEYIETFYKPHLQKYKKRFPSYIDPHLNLIPNYSLFIVQNPILVKEIVKDIFKNYSIDELEEVGATFFEQYLISSYLNGLDVDVDFLYIDNVTSIKDSLKTLRYKFHHYIDYHVDKSFDKKIKLLSEIFNVDLKLSEKII